MSDLPDDSECWRYSIKIKKRLVKDINYLTIEHVTSLEHFQQQQRIWLAHVTSRENNDINKCNVS